MNCSPRVAVVVLARSSSRRLPGKMLLPFGAGTVLSTSIERCSAMSRAHELVLATTDADADDELAREAARLGVRVVRGSEEDVVARMLQAVDSLDVVPDVIVRACADNPLVMPSVVDAAVDELMKSGCDVITPFECATLPFGYGLVVMTRECLERIGREAKDPVYREHVENYCLEHPDQFHLRYQIAPEELVWPELCLTLDYPVDLVRLRGLSAALEDRSFADQPTAAIEHLRAASVWIEGVSTAAPEGHDLLLAVNPPVGVTAPRGVVVVDRFQVGDGRRFGLRYANPRHAGFPDGPLYLDSDDASDETAQEFLARVASLASPLLLAAPARPIDVLEAATPPGEKRVDAGSRRGFRSPADEAFPTQVVLEHAENSPALLEDLLRELESHSETELSLPGGGAEQLARAIECLGAGRVNAQSVAPDPFRVLTIDDGLLEVAGATGALIGSTIAAFWRSGPARTARAEALNREAKS